MRGRATSVNSHMAYPAIGGAQFVNHGGDVALQRVICQQMSLDVPALGHAGREERRVFT